MKINDQILREAIVYCINHSSQKYNDSLKNYILNEMEQKDLLSIYWLGKVLTENDKIEVPEWTTVPLYILAGGALSRGIETGLSKILGKKFQSRIPGAAETLATAGLVYGVGKLAQAVYFMYKRSTDACTFKCRKVVRPGRNYPAQVSICFHQCKVQSLNGLIMKLRQESSMCNQSKYPEKCIQSMNTQIVKYQTELEKELQQLQRSKEILSARLRTVPVSMSSRPSTEKLGNNQ